MNHEVSIFEIAILLRAMAISQALFFIFSTKVAFPNKNLFGSVVFLGADFSCYLLLFITPYASVVFPTVLGLNLLLPMAIFLFMQDLGVDESGILSRSKNIFIVALGLSLVLAYVISDLKSNNLFKALLVVWNVALIILGGLRLWRGYRDDLNRSRTLLRVILSSTAVAYVVIVGLVSSIKPFGPENHLVFLACEGGLLTAVGLLLNSVLVQPQLFNSLVAIDRQVEKTSLPLVRQIEELEAMRGRVQHLMEVEKLYLSHGLTLEDLAEKLGSPVYRVRFLLNQHLGYDNFASFLNPYRLQHAANLLVEPSRSTDKIFAIALESGFSSLAPFNRAFKIRYGTTPSEYREKHQQKTKAT